MTIHADHRQAPVDAQASRSPSHPPDRQPEARAWLILLGAVLVALVVFGAMVGLTMLGGGDGYAPWSP
jgi:hypothetical protein